MKLDTNISTRDKKLLILMAGIVVLAICYLLVFNKLNEKTDEVNAQIEELTPQLEQYKEYEANKEEYEKQTAAAKESIKDTMNHLPSSYNTEDMILYTTKLERDLGIDATSISFADPVAINQFTGVTADNIDDPSTAQDMIAYETQFTVNMNLDYTKMKNLLNEIYNGDDTLTGIDSLAVTYNAETSGLTGTAVLDKFYLTYSGAPDYITSVPATNYGVANPFGTADTTPAQ